MPSKLWGCLAAIGGVLLAIISFGYSMKKSGKNEQVVINQKRDIEEYENQKEAQRSNKKIREDVAAMSDDERISELLRDKT